MSVWRSKHGSEYIIAEVGVNHECNIDRAKKQIELAASGKADGVKFQVYKADDLAIKDSPSYWDLNEESSTNQHQLFSRFDSLGRTDYEQLAEHCRLNSVDFLATPFDVNCVEWLRHLVPFFKIASADITNKPLLEAVGSSGLPVVLSTGASEVKEIERAVDFLEKLGVPELCICHCILSYPTDYKDANLDMISDLTDAFPGRTIGYSDHTKIDKECLVLPYARAFGARVFEKHFTDDKSAKGNDHYHSMDMHDLLRIRANFEFLGQLVGASKKGVIPAEAISRTHARRSLVFTADLPAGHVVKRSDLGSKRPGSGISPFDIDLYVGCQLAYSVEYDSMLQHDHFE